MKTAALKILLIAALRTEDPVATARRVVGAIAAKGAEVREAAAPAPQSIRTAFAEDLAGVAEQLWVAFSTTDEIAMRAGLRKVSRSLGAIESPRLAAALAREAAAALTNPMTPTPDR